MLRSFAIECVDNAAPTVINELIDRIINHESIHVEDGFDKIVLRGFSAGVNGLDQEVLHRLAQLSFNVSRLTVSQMRFLPSADRDELTMMIEKVLLKTEKRQQHQN